MIFNSHGGTKELDDIEALKEELMTRGPVVSTTFLPSDGFLGANPTMGHQNDYLIVGWTQLPAGEVWLVRPLYQRGTVISSPVQVAMGQFGIDEYSLAPTSDFANTPWEEGPYFDGNHSGCQEEWRTWESMCSWLSWAEVEPVMAAVGKLTTKSRASPKITIRNKEKKAHSRKASLSSIGWNEERKKWQVDFDFLYV